jgi:hypothetical protein
MGFNSAFKGLKGKERVLKIKRKHYIAICGEPALEESMNLS